MLPRVVNPGLRLSFLITALALALGINTHAHAQEKPLFEDVTIGSKFSPDPLIVRGMSGGSIPGNQIAGRRETPTGPCQGFFDQKPDHTLELTSNFEYLKLQVQAPEDTTLIVNGPGGSWCNDDLDGKNPGIVGEWLPGKYKVWVGSYIKDKYFPYTLQITQLK
jgi:hypothetical protein